MTDQRDLKKERFVESKKSGMKFRPIYLLALIAIVTGIVVAVVLLGPESEDQEIAFETPAISDTGTSNGILQTGNVDQVNGNDAIATQPPLPLLSVAEFGIKGMTCGGCSGAIMRGLADVDGVTRSNVSWREKAGIVEYNPAVVSPQEIASFITSMGFSTTVVE